MPFSNNPYYLQILEYTRQMEYVCVGVGGGGGEVETQQLHAGLGTIFIGFKSGNLGFLQLILN